MVLLWWLWLITLPVRIAVFAVWAWVFFVLYSFGTGGWVQ